MNPAGERAGHVSEEAILAGEYAGHVSEEAILAGEYAGHVSEEAILAGEYAGHYAGHVSKWLSHPLASMVSAGEYAGHVSEQLSHLLASMPFPPATSMIPAGEIAIPASEIHRPLLNTSWGAHEQLGILDSTLGQVLSIPDVRMRDSPS
ncbi:uncharacterized protein J3D65DRAFT_666781 [Phyllosticta citribraziliensis]|uniref:Uncharacterized protein n=1 Tax=Phyllosticta citribraziliensis TaxID=989973 RepID=A0ABR1LSB0_9PEZI